MRLITVRTPAGQGKNVAELAFAQGIQEVAISTAEVYRSGGAVSIQDVVNIETATPLAKPFIEALMAATFYDPASYSFTVRHPEALFANKPPKEEVHPIVRPSTDVYEELYQFSKVTISLVGRVFLSAVLLSYGMIEDYLPLVIAGLLFLPFHHQMLGIALGGVLKEWTFLRQAALALLISSIVIFLAGVCVALVTEPPVLFEIKGSVLSGAVLAGIIGVAAGLGSIDDAGRRELIGLAATAHIAIFPAWLGLQVVLGEDGQSKIAEYSFSFLINVVTLIVTAILTFAIAGMQGGGIRRFIREIMNNRKA